MSDVVHQVSWPVHVVSRDEFESDPVCGMPARIRIGALRVRSSKLKRLVDFVGAGLGFVILLPLLVIIALAIIMESRGPVFFRQRRSGLNGEVFTIYKFRTMNVLQDGGDVTHATRSDDRVTWIGKFLRRSSIDELPQLINVLKGEMSLVGPRPHAVAHDEYYTQTVPTYHLRFNVKPGITGLAQISGFRGEIRDIPHMEARVAQDLKYIETWSLAMDARILFLTVTSAPFHSSAY